MATKTLRDLTSATALVKTDVAHISQGLYDRKSSLDLMAQHFIRESDFGFALSAVSGDVTITTIKTQQTIYEVDTTAAGRTVILPFGGGGVQAGAIALIHNKTGANTATLTYQSGISIVVPAGGYASVFFDGSAWQLSDNSVSRVFSSYLMIGGGSGGRIKSTSSLLSIRNAGDTAYIDLWANTVNGEYIVSQHYIQVGSSSGPKIQNDGAIIDFRNVGDTNYTNIRCNLLIANVPDGGVAPIQTTSKVMCTNLNTEYLNGYVSNVLAVASTVVLRDPSAGIAVAAGGFSGVITSTVATGTAPFTIASTTKVINLNAEQVDGADLSTDGTFAANSDVLIPSQKAAGTFAKNLVGIQNDIINGDLSIWQRGTSLGSGTGIRYLADMIKSYSAGSTYTVARSSFTVGSEIEGCKFYHTSVVTSVAGSGNLAILVACMNEETLRKHAGKTVTVSFYAKADSAKNIAIEYAQNFGTGGSPSAEVTGIGVNTIALTNSMVKYTATFVVPSITGKTFGTTDGTAYAQLIFWFDAGSSFNSRTNSLGQQSGTFDISAIQITVSDIVLPFIHRDVNETRRICESYYYDSGNAPTWSGNTTSGITYYHYLAIPPMRRTIQTADVTLTNVDSSSFPTTAPTVTVVDKNSGILVGKTANATGSGGTFRYNAIVNHSY